MCRLNVDAYLPFRSPDFCVVKFLMICYMWLLMYNVEFSFQFQRPSSRQAKATAYRLQNGSHVIAICSGLPAYHRRSIVHIQLQNTYSLGQSKKMHFLSSTLIISDHNELDPVILSMKIQNHQNTCFCFESIMLLVKKIIIIKLFNFIPFLVNFYQVLNSLYELYDQKSRENDFKYLMSTL